MTHSGEKCSHIGATAGSLSILCSMCCECNPVLRQKREHALAAQQRSRRYMMSYGPQAAAVGGGSGGGAGKSSDAGAAGSKELSDEQVLARAQWRVGTGEGMGLDGLGGGQGQAGGQGSGERECVLIGEGSPPSTGEGVQSSNLLFAEGGHLASNRAVNSGPCEADPRIGPACSEGFNKGGGIAALVEGSGYGGHTLLRDRGGRRRGEERTDPRREFEGEGDARVRVQAGGMQSELHAARDLAVPAAATWKGVPLVAGDDGGLAWGMIDDDGSAGCARTHKRTWAWF